MKKYLGLAAIVCGLMLVAAPAMAQSTSTPLLTVDDLTDTLVATGAGGFNSIGVANQPTVTQATEHVDWDTYFNATSAPTTTSKAWNFYEPGAVITNGVVISGVLSDTLLITLSNSSVPAFNAHAIYSFVSDTPENSITAISGGINLVEAGPPYNTQSVTSNGGATAASWIKSDIEGVPEPATLLLLGFGLFGLGAVGRKIKK